MRSLIERHGGAATVAPSMREVPLAENPAATALVEDLRAGRIDVIVFLTGVGARALLEAVEGGGCRREEFFGLLDRLTVIVRGPKPTAVLHDWKVRIDHRAPEPNTWRELLAVIDAGLSLEGRTVAVQEYGIPNDELYAGLADRGATVVPVAVYRWALPEDTGPLERAIRETVAGAYDVLLVTSANQVTNALAVAESAGLREAWLAAARRCLVGSIGPTASETLERVGLRVDVEPRPPKMGALVRETLAAATSRTRPSSSREAP